MKKKELRDRYSLQIKIHYNLFIAVFICMLFGALMQYSASNASIAILKKSFSFILISLIAFALIQNLNIRNFTLLFGKYLYFASFLLMFLLLTPAAIESHGAKRWIQVFGIQFQVAEILKISVILYEAYVINYFSNLKLNNKGKYIEILLLWAAGVIPTMLLFILSKDLSSSAVILVITFAVSFVASEKIWPFLAVAGSVIGFVYYYVMKIAIDLPTQAELDLLPFRIGRIAAWIEPERYKSNQGYQVLQSLYATGSGGFFGKGLGRSVIKTRMPEAHTDMIFSIICEELGIVAGAMIIAILAYIVYLIIRVSINAESILESVVALGIAVHIGFQSIVNVGVCLNLIPNTGIGLIFISYGGTALITQMAEIGMVTAISKRHCIASAKRQLKKGE